MATLTITIPAGQVNRVVDAIAARFGYTGFEPDNVTPQTKSEFCRKLIIKYIKDNVKAHEAGTAGKTAFDTAEADAELNITIT